MPVITRFFGIVIKMYIIQDEHNPPHIHALQGEYMSSIIIANGKVLQGDLPKKELKLVLQWLEVHKKKLLKMWNTQKFKTLPPLE
jgi:hypothetical protein